jgi:hypothetical protein
MRIRIQIRIRNTAGGKSTRHFNKYVKKKNMYRYYITVINQAKQDYRTIKSFFVGYGTDN